MSFKYCPLAKLEKCLVNIVHTLTGHSVTYHSKSVDFLGNSYCHIVTYVVTLRYSMHEFNTTIKAKGDPTYWRYIDGDVVHLPDEIGR